MLIDCLFFAVVAFLLAAGLRFFRLRAAAWIALAGVLLCLPMKAFEVLPFPFLNGLFAPFLVDPRGLPSGWRFNESLARRILAVGCVVALSIRVLRKA
jgi:hypothetical protein